ncbi:hydantoinase B/oxoprolinase family protein [Desulfosporosinus metallidurans]|uniref:N-methylhydantoinase B n=1 Tax=Desulfosporosinus metallidurans TaxID=1888891 RepID=A0A1Q8QR84_9FIRM|nr:hydantoinase B/oxoprolinase family protein [Desulfosporosinus metallidurans]OLN29854.1 N-methylhydantoinase B [Desulfosporosinus metallidurans]
MKNDVFLENPVTTEIIRNALSSAAKEMNESLFRSAFTPIIYEMKDCSVGIFNEKAELLGQSAGLPIFLGNLEVAINITTEFFGGIDCYHEGDVYILNDSYLTGTHLNDITVFSPIFYEGKLVGFTATRAHWLDVGAKDPGYPMDATEIYQEGVRIPPLKLMDRGILRDDVANLLCKNSRFYRAAMGDLHAQIAACKTGERRFAEIIKKFGFETVERSIHDIFLQSELMEREAVASIPNGVYYAEGCIDNDGRSDESVMVKLKLTVKDGKLNIDLSGSSSQVKGSTNCGIAQTISACRVAYKQLIHPEAPVTGGCFKPLMVTAPQGSIFTAEEPAACSWYFTSLGLLIDLCVKALEEAMPDKVAGAHYGDSMVIYFAGTNPRTGVPFLDVEATVGGWGGFKANDGQDALINSVNGDFKNLPVEVFETNYPMKITKYAIRPDSAGPGKNRGGDGCIREYESMIDEVYVYLWFERSKTTAWGVVGGKPGKAPNVIIDTGDKQAELLKTSAYRIKKGSKVTCLTGGGGGYGNPFEREPERVLRDCDQGYITREHARVEYGVVITDFGTIDYEETEKVRKLPIKI